MKSRATLVLTIAALIQAALLVGALTMLVLRLREVRADLTRQETGEQKFFDDLAEVERSMYRTSILLRDRILVNREELLATEAELNSVLATLASHPIEPPIDLSPNVQAAVAAAETARREFVERARALTAIDESERQTEGSRHRARQLGPVRQKFAIAAREMDTLVRSLRESRHRAMAGSLRAIQTSTLRILSGAAVLGLILAGVAVWRLRHHERERDIHLRHLEAAEEGLRGLTQELVDSQENERKRISRELHDEVGQNLTALRVQLDQVKGLDPESQGALARAAKLTERSLRTVREIARGLRPAMLDDLGLGPAIQWLGRDFSRSTALDVEVEVGGSLTSLNEAQRTCLYRIVQESLTNCYKHSQASSARVVLQEGPTEVVVTIEDHGRGMASGHRHGIGLLGMRERVEELGGEFTFESSPQAGTLVRATIPTPRSRDDSYSARG